MLSPDIERNTGPAAAAVNMDFILYQPNPTKQMLLYDMATSSSVLTYLKMHNVQFTIKNQTNTEFMSENGRLPVVIEEGNSDDGRPMCGFKEVFWRISRRLKQAPSLLELAYMDWIEMNFLEAEMYICWCHEPILNDYTKSHYTYDLPWPISAILFRRKRLQVQALIANRFTDFDDFCKKFNAFLDQLSKLIGNRPFCPQEARPSAINALIYGHVNAILNTKLQPKLVEAIKWHKRVENLAQLVEDYCPS